MLLSKLNRILLIAFILALSVGCDQITKSVASDTLRGRPPLTYLGNIFRLEYAENSGAFLSLGAGMSYDLRFWLLTVMVGAFLFTTFLYVVFNPRMNRAATFGMSLILGGGASNLLDRILRTDGRVIDFMNLGLGNLRTGIFNVADMVIMVGIGLLIISLNSPQGASDNSSVLTQ